MRETLKNWHARSWPWFEHHARSPHALGWLALVAFSDAIFFPIATELFLVALMLAHPKRWKQFLFVAILFSTIGAAAGYFIAAFLFHQFGLPILNFYHLGEAFRTARRYIGPHVFLTMAVASFTPIPDKVFIYAGGFLGVRFFPFISGYFLGRGTRMALVTYLTGRYGQGVLMLINRYLAWVGVLLCALAIIYGMVHLHLLGL
jgi:membrane protein YqaA with SNARE-associated domain